MISASSPRQRNCTAITPKIIDRMKQRIAMDPHAAEEFLKQHEQREHHAEAAHDEPASAEKVDRFRLVALHEPDGEQIEQHLECPRDAVFALPAPCAGDGARSAPRCGHQSLRPAPDEPVHFAVKMQVLDRFVAIDLQRTSQVMQPRAVTNRINRFAKRDRRRRRRNGSFRFDRQPAMKSYCSSSSFRTIAGTSAGSF